MPLGFKADFRASLVLGRRNVSAGTGNRECISFKNTIPSSCDKNFRSIMQSSDLNQVITCYNDVIFYGMRFDVLHVTTDIKFSQLWIVISSRRLIEIFLGNIQKGLINIKDKSIQYYP